jgi:hypothetical protein
MAFDLPNVSRSSLANEVASGTCAKLLSVLKCDDLGFRDALSPDRHRGRFKDAPLLERPRWRSP